MAKNSAWKDLARLGITTDGDPLESTLSPDDALMMSLKSLANPGEGKPGGNLDPGLAAQPQTPPPAPPQPPQPQAPRMNPMMQGIQDSNQHARAAKTDAESQIRKLLDQPDSATDSMKEQLQKLAGENTHDFNHLDLSPLLAMFAPNMAKTYKAPKSPEEKEQQILDLTGKVSDRENARYKDALQALVGVDKANKEMAPMAALMQDRQANSMHARNVGDLKKDSLLNGYTRQYGNLSNALTQVNQSPLVENGVPMITKPQFDELQQAVRANLGIKGQSGVGERESTYLNPLNLELTRLQSRWDSNPKGIPITDPNVQHILALAKTEQTNVQKLAGSRIDSRSKGFKSIYDSHPELAQDLEDLKSGLFSQFDTGQKSGGAGDLQAAALAEIAKRKGKK